MDVYFVQPDNIHGGELTLNRDESHHFATVNRATMGDEFIAVDGRGTAFRCQISEIDKIVRATILGELSGFGEPHFRLTLAVGVPKKARFEWMVEKGTEIGVVEFVPLLTKRTRVKESSVQVNRLKRIRLAAIKQCRRSALPKISQPLAFESVCKNSENLDIRIILHEEEGGTDFDAVFARLREELPRAPTTGILLIGPEGGFTPTELTFAVERGFTKVWLGRRRLRTETAALTAASLVLDRMAEFS